MGAPVTVWVRWATATVGGVAVALLLMLGLGAMMRMDIRLGPTTKVKVAKGARGANLSRASRLSLVALPSRPLPPSSVPVDALGPVPPVAAAVEPKPKPEEEILNGQIVDSQRPEVEQAPKNAAYLSRYDSKVDKESKAREHRRAAANLGHAKVDEPSKLQSAQSKSLEPTEISTPAAKQLQKTTDQAAIAKIEAQNRPGTGPAPRESQVGRAGSSVVLKGAADGLLLPSTSPGNVAHNLQALAGQAGASDYLPEVTDEGESNLLNTRRFRYWDYFDRGRDKIHDTWDPNKVMRERDPSGEKFGVRNRLTILAVTLGGEGEYKKARVVRGSGLDFLDEEALRAFVASCPWQNPPAGLKNGRGEIEFQFGFMFEMSSQRFKMGGWQ